MYHRPTLTFDHSGRQCYRHDPYRKLGRRSRLYMSTMKHSQTARPQAKHDLRLNQHWKWVRLTRTEVRQEKERNVWDWTAQWDRQWIYYVLVQKRKPVWACKAANKCNTWPVCQLGIKGQTEMYLTSRNLFRFVVQCHFEFILNVLHLHLTYATLIRLQTSHVRTSVCRSLCLCLSVSASLSVTLCFLSPSVCLSASLSQEKNSWTIIANIIVVCM